MNGRYLPDPQITLSSTGDGIVGPEIDLDVDGEWFEYEADGINKVLDKIRAEIELKEKTLTDKYGEQKYGVWTDDVLQIIDKYKVESEE